MEQRKAYTPPEVFTYGHIADLTQQGGRPNADVPRGVDGTAYSPGP